MRDFVETDGRVLHVDFRAGARGRRAVVFANSLGTDLRIWDAVVAALPAETPVLRLDKRGHGLSDMGPVTISGLANDTGAAIDRFGISDALVCGVSVGGMVAQSLAVARPDLVAGLILSNTGLAIGTPEIWTPRIETVRDAGMEPIADAVLERWFSARFMETETETVRGYRNMLIRCPSEGYARTCEAIRDTDLTAQAARITQPAICVAGGADLATPPALVTALCEALPRAEFHLLEDAGHLPCIESPDHIAALIADMLGRLPPSVSGQGGVR
ncbi:3-oxoadipate enol-lactonase [Salinihabitans flavidus]|uniref:3-oxoadipate enol-lactonase n=1 Tax=Salinihabitans flavidus TaxID=569882 RepID=A0A1H8VAF5_9RHOB|nr:3-oxoadipate enol-lactonase [Salinihabitans flavidus]SEP12271.1 3-oxoadipate enol-lactonase [Salinihabitans flavidus]